MPSVDDIGRDLELDRSSREAEIRLLERYLSSNNDDIESKALRRCIVVVSYSHFEGFCKFALTAYVSAINSMGIENDKVCDALLAASMTDVFEALRNDAKKHDLFRKSLPQDADVHRLARQQVFVSSFEGSIRKKIASIPDKVVDAKSNLNAAVLKRNLFILGLSFDFVDEHRSEIDSLLHVRNSVAHGDLLTDPKPGQLEKFQKITSTIMSAVHQEIINALLEKRYLRGGKEAA